MLTLTKVARDFINSFQGDFPLSVRPYRTVAAALNLDETSLIAVIRSLLSENWLSRFGPVYNASRFGGAQTLAALEVPSDRYEEVTGIVNGFEEVAHNYRRENRLNMWFVLATEQRELVGETLARIEGRTGLPVYNFPKLREFYLGLHLVIDEQGGVHTVPAPAPGSDDGYRLDGVDRRLVLATQTGLPLQPEPYAVLGDSLGLDEPCVRKRLDRMLASGAIRRIGAVPNHYRLGLVANGMTVWDIHDEFILRAGQEIGRLPFVSHCYQRTRHPGIWPYNLFAMVHGVTRTEVEHKRAQLAEVLGTRCRAHDMLVSSACLKKTGLRLAA